MPMTRHACAFVDGFGAKASGRRRHHLSTTVLRPLGDVQWLVMALLENKSVRAVSHEVPHDGLDIVR
jgi:hypothetical protein